MSSLGWTFLISVLVSTLFLMTCHAENASIKYFQPTEVEQYWAPEEEMQPPTNNVQLLEMLVNPENYDKHRRPLDSISPINVTARAYIYIMQSIEGRLHLLLKLNMKLQLGFRDPRLEYAKISPRTAEVTGGAELLHKIWTPHVFLANERDSFLMTSGAVKDVLVRIFPDGQVLMVTRLTARVICTMKYGRFPFDQQECPLVLESWLDDEDDLVLRWAQDNKAITYSEDLSLSSFTIQEMKAEEELLQRSRYREKEAGRFGNRYWSLKLTFFLARLQGFFIMDYYIPSILLVVISWVSFWLEPDMVPARVLLGSSTILSFITLAVQTDKALPISYVKASEIWFVGCCSFIFGSLVEFAFVNTIWRHGQSVELKKVNTRHILKSTLGTPRPPRRRLLPQERYARRRTSSLPDLFQGKKPPPMSESSLSTHSIPESHPTYYNTIHNGALRRSKLESVCESVETTFSTEDIGSTASVKSIPSVSTLEVEDTIRGMDRDSGVAGIRRHSIRENLQGRLADFWGGGRRIAVSFTPGFTRMSAQEVSDWIDRRSRVAFPLAFLVFNFLYWTSVWFY